MKWERAVKYCRWDSGTHFLDSGGEKGRHWQQPAPEPGNVVGEHGEIVVARLLSKHFNENEGMTEDFMQFSEQEDYRHDSYFENETDFMQSLGYVSVARDNTYNSENDLDQQLIWQVWVQAEYKKIDWCWAVTGHYTPKEVLGAHGRMIPTMVVTVCVHTGADVRGGYSPPVFGLFEGDLTIPDMVVGWHLVPVPRNSAKAKVIAEKANDRGKYTAGNSRNPRYPRYHLESDADEVKEVGDGRLKVKLEGYTFYAHPEFYL